MSLPQYHSRAIALEDRAAVDAIRLQTGHTLSSHAFVSLYLWQRAMGLSICLHENAFFVQIQSRGENAWMFPCGTKEIKLSFLRAGSNTPGFSLHYVREEDIDFLNDCLPGLFAFSETRGDAEYLYSRTAQLEMPGGAYKNLRVKVRRAKERHCWQVCTLDADSLTEAADTMLAWHSQRGDPGDLDVGLLALRQYRELGMHGVILRDEAGVQAVALGSLIAPGVFDLHVTKTLMPGLDAYLKWELYRRLSDTVEWIDQEEDLDFPGLRTNKLESKPDKLIPLWKGVPTG